MKVSLTYVMLRQFTLRILLLNGARKCEKLFVAA